MFWLLPWHQQKTVTLASTQIKTVCSGHYPGINKTVTLASTQINTVCSGHYPGIYKRQLPWPQNKYSTFCYYPGINANTVHSVYYPGATKELPWHQHKLKKYDCYNYACKLSPDLPLHKQMPSLQHLSSVHTHNLSQVLPLFIPTNSV